MRYPFATVRSEVVKVSGTRSPARMLTTRMSWGLMGVNDLCFRSESGLRLSKPKRARSEVVDVISCGLTRVAPASAHVRPHAGIIVLRSLLLFCKVPPRLLLYWLPGLQVDDRVLVHLIRVCQHLNVDLGMAVLDDGAKISLDRVVLFGSPRDL